MYCEVCKKDHPTNTALCQDSIIVIKPQIVDTEYCPQCGHGEIATLKEALSEWKDEYLKSTNRGAELIEENKRLKDKLIKQENLYKATSFLLEKEEAENKRLKELIKAQADYLALLGTEIGKNSSFLAVHGIKCSNEVYQEGIKCRENIQKAEQAIGEES